MASWHRFAYDSEIYGWDKPPKERSSSRSDLYALLAGLEHQLEVLEMRQPHSDIGDRLVAKQLAILADHPELGHEGAAIPDAEK